MSDLPTMDDYRRARGLDPDDAVDFADHQAWLAEEVGGTDVVLHDGDLLEVVDDLEVAYLTHWEAPYTGGGSGILPRGTRVRVLDDPVPQAVGFAAIPLEEEAIEQLLIPESDREQPKYAGYHLSLLKRDVGPHLRRVD